MIKSPGEANVSEVVFRFQVAFKVKGDFRFVVGLLLPFFQVQFLFVEFGKVGERQDELKCSLLNYDSSDKGDFNRDGASMLYVSYEEPDEVNFFSSITDDVCIFAKGYFLVHDSIHLSKDFNG